MMNIITSEVYKIFKSKVFYVVSIILLAMNAIFIYVQASADKKAQMLGTGITNYQGSYDGDIIFYIILIFVACLVTAEYANGSIRQMACHGIARWKLVLGQYIAISSVITVLLLAFGVLNLLSATIIYKLGEVDAVVFIRMNVGMLCMFWGIAGIGTFLSYLFKNGGITIAISVLLIIGGNFIIGMLISLTKNDIFARYSLGNMRKIIINFTSKPEDVVKYSIVFLLIGAVTILGSSLLFSKRDVD